VYFPSSLPQNTKHPSAFFRSKRLWLISTIPAIGLISVIAILYHIGVLPLGNGYALILFGMFFMETLFMTTGDLGAKLKRRSALELLIVWIPMLLILILSALIPSVGSLTELGVWNLAGVAILPVVPLLGLVCMFSRKKEN